MSAGQEIVFITSPLEDRHVARIRAEAPEHVTIVHEPDLHPATRYIADHKGVDGFVRTQEQEQRWRDNSAARRSCGISRQAKRARAAVSTMPPTSNGFRRQVPRRSTRRQVRAGGSSCHHHYRAGIHAVPLAEFVMMALLMHTKRLLHLQSEQSFIVGSVTAEPICAVA